MIRLAHAHDGALQGSWWTLDPLVLGLLLVSSVLYWKGVRSSWARAGVGRGVRRAEAACFAGGMAGLFLALVWPLDVLGEELFSAHMAQHLVLMNLAAPLLVLGAPVQAMIRAAPRAWRRAAAPLVPRPGLAFATVLQLAMLGAWHTPRGLAAALGSDPVHVAMHASLLVAALLFWSAVLRPAQGQYWGAIAALLVTLKLTGVASILLLIRPGALYAAYGDLAAAWGLLPAQDEQLGWGFMMIVGTLSYLGAAVTLFAASFARLEARLPSLRALSARR